VSASSVIADACESPTTDGTRMASSDAGVVHALVGSVPAMNWSVWMFWGSVYWFGKQYGLWVTSTATAM